MPTRNDGCNESRLSSKIDAASKTLKMEKDYMLTFSPAFSFLIEVIGSGALRLQLKAR